MYDEIRYEVEGPMALVTLSRPEAMNAWTDTMAKELRDAVERAEADPEVVAIVITGEGRGFCAGADLRALSSIAAGNRDAVRGAAGSRADAPAAEEPDDFAGTYTYLLATSKPVIAAVNGAVAGMAVALILSCDLRFMADDAVVLTAFSQRGLVAEWGSSWLLPRLVGPANALDMFFSSRKVGGQEAARIGLVNASMPGDQLLDHCRAYVQHLADHCSPSSMAAMKRQVYEQLHRGLGAAEVDSVRLMLGTFTQPDFAEGVDAFLSKRPPQFRRLPVEGSA